MAPSKILAISIDMDGCIFNESYFLTQSVKKSNQNILNYIKSRIDDVKPDKVLLLVGSARQDYRLDLLNSNYNNTHSAIDAIREIAISLRSMLPKNEVKMVQINGLLLADLYSGESEGYSFKLIKTSLEKSDYDYSTHPSINGYDKTSEINNFDDYKYNILYAQIHSLSSRFEGSKIYFDFVDDRSDIHAVLYAMFNSFSKYLPINVQLRLNSYSGCKVLNFSEKYYKGQAFLPGYGDYDPYYAENIKFLPNVSQIVGKQIFSMKVNLPQICEYVFHKVKGHIDDFEMQKKASLQKLLEVHTLSDDELFEKSAKHKSSSLPGNSLRCLGTFSTSNNTNSTKVKNFECEDEDLEVSSVMSI